MALSVPRQRVLDLMRVRYARPLPMSPILPALPG